MSISSHSPYNRRTNEIKIDSKEKDMLISQLKAHIFELEQHEKDYDNLNQKFRSIQNECSLLSEEKLRLEYELKQRTECLNKQILDLRTELENMQLNFNDKLVINKKLYNENNNLLKSLDLKSLENHDLKERLDELSDEYRRISEEKINLERMVHNLNDLKSTQKIEIGKLAEDNQRLIKICSDHEKQLKSMDTERIKLFSKIDELNFTLKNLNGKLASREENLGHINRQFDESKNLNIKLQQTVRDFEKQSDFQRGEIANLNNQLQKERNQRHDVDKELDNLKLLLMDRDKTINRYLTELDSSKNLNQRLNEEKMEVINDNGKMDGFISVLTKQNDDLSRELRAILEEDERIRQQLLRKNKVMEVLKNNKNVLDKSLANLDEFLSRSSTRGGMSPNYQLNRSNDNY